MSRGGLLTRFHSKCQHVLVLQFTVNLMSQWQTVIFLFIPPWGFHPFEGVTCPGIQSLALDLYRLQLEELTTSGSHCTARGKA